MLLRDGYLRTVALLLVLLNLASTTGEYVLGRSVVDALTREGALEEAAIGAFYGNFYLGVNVAALALQLFAASRLVRRFGIGGVLYAMPLFALLAFGGLALGLPALAFVWLKGAMNASDYSLMNTARAMLWLPTSRDAKYAAKHTADTLVVRLGDLASAGVVFVGTTLLGLGASGFAALGAVFAGLWLALAVALRRGYVAR